MYRQMRGWRHDYKNHIQTMKALAESGDMESIKAYLDMLDTDLNTVDTVIKTGDPMADAILNSKLTLASSNGIPAKIDAHIPVKLKTSQPDLCVIPGNLFDSFTNMTASKKQPKLAGRFLSTKGEGHGLGLLRIDSIIHRLDGYLSRNSEDGAFTTEILLPQV